MIARIEGQLESIEQSTALIRPAGSGLTYAVLLPAFAAARLGGRIGKSVTLETMAFLESNNQGASFTPRLAGFLSRHDREFFELLVTCKGIGNRKALRAMTMDCSQIAGAISDRDVSLLQTLPEVGKRTAETIVATLRGKVERFIGTAGNATGDISGESDNSDGQGESTPSRIAGGLARESLEVLIALGEQRTQAVNWIDEVLRDTDHPVKDVEALVQRVYQMKAQTR